MLLNMKTLRLAFEIDSFLYGMMGGFLISLLITGFIFLILKMNYLLYNGFGSVIPIISITIGLGLVNSISTFGNDGK